MEIIPLIWTSLLWFSIFAVVALTISFILYKRRMKTGASKTIHKGGDSINMNLKDNRKIGTIDKIGDKSTGGKSSSSKSSSSSSRSEKSSSSSSKDRQDRESGRRSSDRQSSSRDRERDRDRESSRNRSSSDRERDRARDRDRERDKERDRDRERDSARDKQKPSSGSSKSDSTQKRKRLPSRSSRIQILNKLTNEDKSDDHEFKYPKVKTSRNPSTLRRNKLDEDEDYSKNYDDDDFR